VYYEGDLIFIEKQVISNLIF